MKKYIMLSISALAISACKPFEPALNLSSEVNLSQNANPDNGGGNPPPGPVGSATPTPSPTASPGPVVAGNGANVTGSGAFSVPTGNAIISRLTNGLQKNVSPSAGNFARALAQVRSNLPKVTDPLKATGYDQIQLLVYGACSDLTTGTTPLMQTKYNVNPANTIAASQAALVAAGLQMLDQYTGSLASQGPTSAQVTASYTSLVTTVAATAGNTSKIAFMSVCIAANTAGITMMGY